MKAAEPLVFRPARVGDGRTLWALARDSEVLETNSAYAYLLLSSHFAATSVVVESGSTPVGFIAGYRPPSDPEAVFVWQIAVDSRWRGRRIASRMLHALLRQDGCRGARYVEATVTPSNRASAALFRSLARDLGVPCEERPHFAAELFPGEGHESEMLFRIGPLANVRPRPQPPSDEEEISE